MVRSEQNSGLKFSPTSVALCTFNGEKFLQDLLDSILYQSIPADEIIIVDDSSSDGTVEILKQYADKFPQIRLHLQDVNLGPIDSFEKAIQLTRYSYIFLADQDDIWKPNKIESMLSVSANIPDDKPLLVFSDLEVIDEYGNLIFPSFWKMAGLKPHISTFKSLLFSNSVTGCASMINAKMKGFMVSIPKGVLMHDHWIALIAYGFGQIILLNDQLVKYRSHSKSVTSKNNVNIFWKITKQIDQFSDIYGDFLKREINQGILFNNSFRNYLSNENQNHLDRFIDLKNKSLLQRKIESYLRYKN